MGVGGLECSEVVFQTAQRCQSRPRIGTCDAAVKALVRPWTFHKIALKLRWALWAVAYACAGGRGDDGRFDHVKALLPIISASLLAVGGRRVGADDACSLSGGDRDPAQLGSAGRGGVNVSSSAVCFRIASFDEVVGGVVACRSAATPRVCVARELRSM